MSLEPIIEVKDLYHEFKTRTALKKVSFSVKRGDIFGILGPNGSGKTTLFRILSTLFAPTAGDIRILGFNLFNEYEKVRAKTGIVFQAQSLDIKLSVRENLIHQGHLYGLRGEALNQKVDELLNRFGLDERALDIVETLSGGLQRRVELAKGLIHDPELLILDEPSTGLDPGARIDLWKYLTKLRAEKNVTILVTTHLMEEAEHCGHVVIFNEGSIVAEGTPKNLKAELGGEVIHIKTKEKVTLKASIHVRFGIKAAETTDGLYIEHPEGHRFIPDLMDSFPGRIEGVVLRKPTLEDVFVHKTGHQFWSEKADSVTSTKEKKYEHAY